jgi:anti-sigma factor RsiW
MTNISTLTLHTINNEARILDTDLAQNLGYQLPRQVRELIKRNEAELNGFGTLSHVTTNSSGGRPATAYYLNEEQALLVCMFSKTENAMLVRKQIIATFMAYRRGQLVPAAQTPAVPRTFAEALRLAADQAEKIEQLETEINVIKPVIEEVTIQSWAGQQHIYLSRSDSSRLQHALRAEYRDLGMQELPRIEQSFVKDGITHLRKNKVYHRHIIDDVARRLGLIS